MTDETQAAGADPFARFSQYELADTYTFNIQTPRRDDDLLFEGKPVRVTVFGPGSKQGVRAQHVAGQAAQSRLQMMVRGKAEKNAAENADAERVAKLVTITAGIENFPYPGGPEAIYSNPKFVDFADQVEAAFNDKGNFQKPSPKA